MGTERYKKRAASSLRRLGIFEGIVMALKKSDLYASLWASSDQLRGGMDASQYKDYILTLLFVKYVSDKAKADPYSLIVVPDGGSFDDMLAAKGDKEIGDRFNKIIGKLAEANGLRNVIDLADFNDEEKLGRGKEMQDRLSKLVTIFNDLDFQGSRAEGDDLLGDAYEYLMRHFATESGKSKGQFYTPAEVSRVVAQVIGIGSATRQDETVYDPACGSGSLLLKAVDEAPRGMTIYGQEKDNDTWALAKMNMILHDNAEAEIAKGDTLTSPQFLINDRLRTFDYVVMNPPFSVKAWSNGLEHDYDRFEYGRPPEKNGDYAFLLHALTSLNSTGKAAVILPHGVLFRGNTEATIRTRLLKQGFIRGIIGLPANLFYGTGIPACIIVLDKEDAQARTEVFMIDASKGVIKDGNKNRLRSQDIHKIVDTFNQQLEIDGYSRMVALAEIANEQNDYNLNIPRYIDASEPEDLQDLSAHIHGGIPNADLDALQDYWDAFPQLRDHIFKPNRPGYSDLAIDTNEVQQAILDSQGFHQMQHEATKVVATWFETHRELLATVSADITPRELITTLSEDLLQRFTSMPLLDEYAVYQQLMSYWHEVMNDDVYLVLADGWSQAAMPRQTIEDKQRKLVETPDLTLGTGRSRQKYKMDLIPPKLVVARYFSEDRDRIEALKTQRETLVAEIAEHAAEHGADEGLLAESTNDKGAYVKGQLTAIVQEAKNTHDQETLDLAKAALKLLDAKTKLDKDIKQAQHLLDEKTLTKYGDLTEQEIKNLVLDDKWLATVQHRVTDELEALTLNLVRRIKELGQRYDKTVNELAAELSRLETQVTEHLNEMGIKA